MKTKNTSNAIISIDVSQIFTRKRKEKNLFKKTKIAKQKLVIANKKI